MNRSINLGVAGKAIHRRVFVPVVLLVFCAFSFSSTGFADELVSNGSFELPVVPQGDIVIELELVCDGLTSPIYATGAGDRSDRLFIVDQVGTIRRYSHGTKSPTSNKSE